VDGAANPDAAVRASDYFDNKGLTERRRIRSVTMRPIASAPPPAANGTITMIGRDG
jgi:hypothetical protein